MSLDDQMGKQNIKPFIDYFDSEILAVKTNDPKPSYMKLIKSRKSLDPALFAYCSSRLLRMNTAGVPTALRLELIKANRSEDLMHKSEIEKLRQLPEELTVFRGATYEEIEPGLSWSLDKTVAENFYRGKMYRAQILKSEVFAYFDDQNESEILAHIDAKNAEIIQCNPNIKEFSLVAISRKAEQLANRFSCDIPEPQDATSP